MEATFTSCPILRANYSSRSQILKVVFKNKSGLQERSYAEVPGNVGAKLIYMSGRTAKDVMAFFRENIKQKFKVIEIKNPKF